MTANPWSKFFWNDWDRDSGLRLCSFAAQGLWMRLLCMAGRSDGKVLLNGEPPTADQLGRLYGENPENISAWMGELENNFVFSKNKNGIIFSRRMIKDQKKIKIARENGKSGGNPSLGKQKQIPPLVNPPDNHPLKQVPSGISTLPLNPHYHLTTEPLKKDTISIEIVGAVASDPPPYPAEEFQDLRLPEFLDRREKREPVTATEPAIDNLESPANPPENQPPGREKKPRSAAKREPPKTKIPADWGIAIGDENYRYATEIGMTHQDLEREADKFIAHHESRGTTMADWAAAWRYWVRNWQTFSQQRRA